ncbi:hypothetical protein Tco_1016253 [Tanacetum coccineum]|uniref:Reverse transcriptase domain-containing protein n=1 Tax=Tanacetum coccineum TaxID=301880 RepID=A0ABQ5FPG2_9ASTR
MRTRSQSRNSNRQQQQVNPTFVEPFNLVEPIENQAPPVVTMDDTRTMAQLLEAPTVGYEDAIVVPEITADNFELKHGLLTLVQNKQFFGHDKEDPHAHIRYFNKITSTMKFPNVPSTSVKLMLFPFSLEGAARIWLEKEPPRSILTWDDLIVEFAKGGKSFVLDKMPRDCLRIIESKSKVCNSRNKPVVAKVSSSSSTPGISPDVAELKDMVKALLLDKKNQTQAPAPVKAVEESCVTCGGAHSYRNCLATDGNVYRDNIQEYVSQAAVANFNQGNTGYRASIANQIRPPVERETKVTKDTVPPTNNGSTKDVQPLVVQVQHHVPNSEPVVAPISAPMPNSKRSIPYPSRRNDERRREKANDQIEKFYKIFKDLSFEISLTDALIIMPKFALTLKALIGNKEKLSEIWDLNFVDEHLAQCGHPHKLPKNGGSRQISNTDRFDYPTDRFIAEDVDLKVGSFQFPIHPDHALIDVYEGELTLRVGKEAITFNLDQTSRYSSNYDDNSANRIDVIYMTCEEYSQEVLGFSDVIASGSPTPYYDPIVSTSSPTLTPFGDSDFLLEEVDAFLALEDDPTSPEVDHSYYDSEGDILLLEAFLNDDPSLPPPTQGNYLPEIRKELKVCEAKNDKSSIDEPPEVELKDLPPHLEYAFLEGDDKLPVIIAKDLSVEEKAALIKVLKSHKRAIAWKLSDIKGINPEFYTHKILMEEDYEPAVQHQRLVNPKIHDVIKKEVEKLLDAGLIYPISDSPWCMRTRSQSRNLNRQQQAPPAFVEPFNLEEPIENPAPPVAMMDNNRTMAQLLETPTEGYEDSIVVPEITAYNLSLSTITSTMKFPNVPSTGSLPSNTVTNPKEVLKGITTRSGVAYQGPTTTTTSSPRVVERETKVTKDTVLPTNNGTLIENKEKLSEMARTPLNEHCSAVLSTCTRKKLGDPGKFLIPCDFPRMDECLSLADLGASINLMPLSVCKRISLSELTPTCMTLELAENFDADPRVPLILGRSFLKTGRALIDVYEGELTLRVGKEAITFNLDPNFEIFFQLR